MLPVSASKLSVVHIPVLLLWRGQLQRYLVGHKCIVPMAIVSVGMLTVIAPSTLQLVGEGLVGDYLVHLVCGSSTFFV